jgi:hypothetical protein
MRLETSPEQEERYLGMIDAASAEVVELLDLLSLVARVEGDRYDPVVLEADTAELARAGAELAGEGVSAGGTGAEVQVDVSAVGRALGSLARCAKRHGGVEAVTLEARGTSVLVAPVVAAAAPIVLGEELRDLGAAIAVRVVRALGGDVALDGETLVVTLPQA